MGRMSAWGVSAWRCLPGGCVCIPASTEADTPPPPVNRMTDRCKNITFANFVCGRSKQKLKFIKFAYRLDDGVQGGSPRQLPLQLEDLSPAENSACRTSARRNAHRDAVEFNRHQSASMNPRARVLVSVYYIQLLFDRIEVPTTTTIKVIRFPEIILKSFNC